MMKTKMLVALFCGLMFTGLAQAEKIRIATEGAYPPFNMKNAKGELVGFDVDIAKALCDQMKADCEIVDQDWDGMIPGLLAKKYDAIIAGMSITEERKRKVSFTDPYYSNYLRFIAKKGNGLTISPDGLKGKNLGAQRATTSAQHLEDNYRKSANVKVYDTQDAVFLDLKAGRLDAALVDAYPGYDWLTKPENADYDHVGDTININDKIGIAIRKGDKALAEKFNTALKALLDNGTYESINAKYFPFSIY
ncbi:MAG: ABC transporter substrate-binding protein [Chromatiales bacterium]|jgi:polar amino acid transport system substrate-binding protein